MGMMDAVSLSRRDANVLDKINDPECNPAAAVQIDPTLPKDPVITNSSTYEQVTKRERDVILSIQRLESRIAGQVATTAVHQQARKDSLVSELDPDLVEWYQRCVVEFGDIISDHPNYASARNNRAQALRRLHGDTMLLQETPSPQALIRDSKDHRRAEASKTALSDLDTAIALLTPQNPHSTISPQAGKTLALAHTQRAAIYHVTARFLPSDRLEVDATRREARWSKTDFEQAALRDFALGGRYGNDIAKGLAVSANPTAKLCGQIVREAMKEEYGSSFEV